VAECQFIKKRELSKKLDQYQIPNSSMINQESEELELEVATINSEPLDLKKETSTGLPNLPLEKQEFWMLFIMHQTMN
jgi:hypothetical protein